MLDQLKVEIARKSLDVDLVRAALDAASDQDRNALLGSLTEHLATRSAYVALKLAFLRLEASRLGNTHVATLEHALMKAKMRQSDDDGGA